MAGPASDFRTNLEPNLPEPEKGTILPNAIETSALNWLSKAASQSLSHWSSAAAHMKYEVVAMVSTAKKFLYAPISALCLR